MVTCMDLNSVIEAQLTAQISNTRVAYVFVFTFRVLEVVYLL